MRRIVHATAATVAILTAGSLAPNRVGAMTVTMPTGLQAAIDTTTLLEDVAVVCRRVCGVYGCVQRCRRTAPYYRLLRWLRLLQRRPLLLRWLLPALAALVAVVSQATLASAAFIPAI